MMAKRESVNSTFEDIPLVVKAVKAFSFYAAEKNFMPLTNKRFAGVVMIKLFLK